MSKLSEKIDELSKIWYEPIKNYNRVDQTLSPNFAIAKALEEVARAIRLVEKSTPSDPDELI